MTTTVFINVSDREHKDSRRFKKENFETGYIESIVIWKKPLTTLELFICEALRLAKLVLQRLYREKVTVAVSLAVCLFVYGSVSILFEEVKNDITWGLYWLWLGILSSIGLGTGLHTFLLFLGPFIAKVTLASYECGSTDFPKPPYPDDLTCGEVKGEVTMWSIMCKVRFPAFCWGFGTALGELPPYFMARAAKLSGVARDDNDEFEEVQQLLHAPKSHLTIFQRAKLIMYSLIQKVGFFGILAAASIPNPLFDLAGITCGHFLVPFWTFFGATVIGKAIVKMHIQKIFIIFIFSEHHVESLIDLIKRLPLGKYISNAMEESFSHQRRKLHEGASDNSDSVIGKCLEIFIVAMVIYFVLAIINSLAQKRAIREREERIEMKFN